MSYLSACENCSLISLPRLESLLRHKPVTSCLHSHRVRTVLGHHHDLLDIFCPQVQLVFLDPTDPNLYRVSSIRTPHIRFPPKRFRAETPSDTPSSPRPLWEWPARVGGCCTFGSTSPGILGNQSPPLRRWEPARQLRRNQRRPSTSKGNNTINHWKRKLG